MRQSLVFAASLCALLTLATSQGTHGESSRLAGVFSAWDGAWEGDFKILRPGEEPVTIRTRHVYRSESAILQRVTITDTMPDGSVVRKTADNIVDGEELLCRVFREDGSLEVEHRGELVENWLVWSSLDEDGRPRQIFRERVVEDDYLIDGVGIYGTRREIVEIYVGRYHRVEPK